MKITGILTTLVMTLMVFSPFSISLSLSPEADMTCIVTLDVCHAKDGLGPANTDLPACCENVFIPAVPEATYEAVLQPYSALSFDLPLVKDRPPKS